MSQLSTDTHRHRYVRPVAVRGGDQLLVRCTGCHRSRVKRAERCVCNPARAFGDCRPYGEPGCPLCFYGWTIAIVQDDSPCPCCSGRHQPPCEGCAGKPRAFHQCSVRTPAEVDAELARLMDTTPASRATPSAGGRAGAAALEDYGRNRAPKPEGV